MLLTIEKTVTETQQVEVKLPAYYIDRYGMVYMIAEDESLLTVGSGFINLKKKDSYNYKQELLEITQAAPATREDFHQKYTDCINLIQNQVLTPEELPY